MSAPGPDVAVIVPLFNGRQLIADCLRSIPDGVETIVVDDGSTDGAPAVVRDEFPHVTLRYNERNLGFGASCNHGLRVTQAAVRIVLNSDAVLHPGALQALCDAMAEPGVGIVGARRRFPDGSHQTSAARFPTLGSIVTGSFLVNELFRKVFPGRRFRWELGLSEADHAEDRDVEWVSGTCLGISARCFDDTGGFDEAYHLYVEETDLCWRARRAGWRVRYVAGAEVTHVGGGSTGDPAVHARRFLRSEARFMARANGSAILPSWRAARTLGSSIKVGVLIPVATFDAQARDRLRWHWSALRYLIGADWRGDAHGE